MLKCSNRLETDFIGLHLENPFLLSAGPSTDALSMARRGLEAGWAGLILKTTSLNTAKVNLAYPMMSRFDSYGRFAGMGNIDLISIHHIDEVAQRVKILKSAFPHKIIGASIMSDSIDGWRFLARELKAAGADLIECSFSCPQGNMGEDAGKMLAQSEKATEKIAQAVKEAAGDLPVLIKITPQVTDIAAIARAVKSSGCDGVTASNSIPALMGIDIESMVPIPVVGGKSTYSGLSGPAIKPITLRTIAEIARHVPDLPVSGNGGVRNWQDAVELMAVGAGTIQICTAVMLHGFGIIEDLVSGLDNYLECKGYDSVMRIIGLALPHICDHDSLPRLRPRSRVVESRCVGCGLCYVACRDGGHEAINWNQSTRLPKVDVEKCVGCGLCLLLQPVEGCLELVFADNQSSKGKS